MKNNFYKILILIVGVFYLQAVFEVNTATIKNTWGDEYDTYIHSQNHSVKTSLEIISFENIAALPDYFDFNIIPNVIKLQCCLPFKKKPPSNKKIFLKNSLLLI